MDRLISEKKAIEAINDYWGEMETPTIDGYINAIKNIPSAEPNTGHWIYDRTRDWDGECKYECSECGMGSDVDYAYCMRCGARMVKPQETKPEISSYYGLKSYVRERSEE